jgi:hypothetical protein
VKKMFTVQIAAQKLVTTFTSAPNAAQKPPQARLQTLIIPLMSCGMLSTKSALNLKEHSLWQPKKCTQPSRKLAQTCSRKPPMPPPKTQLFAPSVERKTRPAQFSAATVAQG